MTSLILPPTQYVAVLGAQGREALRIEDLHRRAALLLGLRYPVRVVISENVPKRYLAVTSRDADGACRLVYRSNAVTPRVIAHESCHCLLDYHRLSPTGWDPYVVGESLIPKLEKAADQCGRNVERRLIAGGVR